MVAVGEAEVTINGLRTPLGDAPVWTTALDFLREQGLTGCKEGCAEGECGACSVLVARPGVKTPTEWVAINACLVPIAALDGQEVITAEGLGSPDALHPVQREMALRGGSQCGYCTPGFVCSMAGEYYRPDRAPAHAVQPDGAPAHAVQPDGAPASAAHTDGAPVARAAVNGDPMHGPNGFDLHALSGNLCRCTGYRPIRDAAYALDTPPQADPLAARATQPPPAPVPTRLRRDGRRFTRPETLTEAVAVLHDDPETIVIAGCTDHGVEVNLRGTRPEAVLAVDRLPELRELTIGTDTIEIGAALTLTEIERRLDGRVPLLDELFPQFASRLIRNGATLGGNLGTGSPIGDGAPVLLALDARVVLTSVDGEREVALADYFTGYRQSVRRADELIRAVRIPLPLAPLAAFHKIAKRRFDDISSVAVAFAIDRDAAGSVGRARIGLGGVAATPVRALGTEEALTGRPWSQETVEAAAEILGAEGTPIDDHRASARYRAATLRTSLLKLYADNPALEGALA
ncbi:MAG TPA: FAD binding domain-containing protein [Solirubrobacteraceae bacterium]|nr:FAD binding domain-containing protein [Solirubrobacteraceae bacterium]